MVYSDALKSYNEAKVSFDKQILAIAVANEVKTIYFDDKGVKNFGVFLCAYVSLWLVFPGNSLTTELSMRGGAPPNMKKLIFGVS